MASQFDAFRVCTAHQVHSSVFLALFDRRQVLLKRNSFGIRSMVPFVSQQANFLSCLCVFCCFPTGSLFAFLSFVESLTTNTSLAVFNSVYSATVAWYPTFAFMLSAILCLIPLIVLGYVSHSSTAERKICLSPPV